MHCTTWILKASKSQKNAKIERNQLKNYIVTINLHKMKEITCVWRVRHELPHHCHQYTKVWSGKGRQFNYCTWDLKVHHTWMPTILERKVRIPKFSIATQYRKTRYYFFNPKFISSHICPRVVHGSDGPASRVGSGHDFAGFWRVGSGRVSTSDF